MSPLATTCPEELEVSDQLARTPNAKELVAAANEAFARGDAERARELFRAALKITPGDPELSVVLGHLEMQLDDLPAALENYTTAALRRPDFALAHSSRAVALQLLGHPGEAALAANRALKFDSKDTTALKVLARIFLNGRQNDLAQDVCRRILKLDQNDADAQKMLEQALTKPVEKPAPKQPGAAGQWSRAAGAVIPNAFIAGANPTISSDAAREQIEKFYAASNEYFADVMPPQLTEAELAHSRIVPSRIHILPLLPKGGVCAEIGTQTGGFAKLILSVMQPSKLHIFDLDFTPFDHAHFQSAMDQGIVQLHRGDSSTLLGELPEKSFDFIYVDGNHCYDGVVKDLAQADLRIKDDGWIVCNDYTVYSPPEGVKYGVYRAVNEFCLQRGYEIVYLGLHSLGYHDVALRKRPAAHLGGASLDQPDRCTYMPDVWEYLVKKYQITSALDVGAGAGWSTKWFVEQGLRTVGVEGWQEALARSQCRTHIVEHDFSHGPFAPGKQFDLCWCSEFVEHVEERFSPNFLASFQACKYVCMTHAVPGQAGYHHVNCQTTEYWINRLGEAGFEYDAEETAYLRSTNTENTPWGRCTLTFFKKKS